MDSIEALLNLSHELGREDRQLAILGEGNTSMRLSDDTFAVKASGSNLATLARDGLSACRFDTILPLFESGAMSDEEVDEALLKANLVQNGKKPSTEALFHAYLLTLPDVNFVGHTHPVGANSLLCSPHAREFAVTRIFPDEVVCCGTASIFVPYTDPGVPLAAAIRHEVGEYVSACKVAPRLILLQNHGIIALGATPQAVLATTLMAEKSARIRLNAGNVGGPVPLAPEHVARIANRPDEAYRQKVLKLS